MVRSNRNILIHILLILIILVTVAPVFWMIISAFKTEGEILAIPPQFWPKKFYFGGFKKMLSVAPWFRYLFNTLYVCLLTILGQLVVSSFAAYAFARLRFPNKQLIFYLFLGTMMVPFQTMMIPVFRLLRVLSLLDSPYALILPGLFNAFTIFLFRQFFLGIPRELEESAKIDGCGYFKIYVEIIMRNSASVISAMVIFTFVGVYNDFIRPLIYINSGVQKTLSLALASFRGQYSVLWNELMAASIMSVIPMLVIYLALQRYFIQGIVNTGIKG